MSRYCRGAIATAAILAAVPVAYATAQTTPTLKADRACYTPGERMTLTTSGFAPGSSVGFFFQLHGPSGNQLLAGREPDIVDPGGNTSSQWPAPKLASSDDFQEHLSITANQQPPAGQPATTDPMPFAAADVLLSTWDVLVAPWDRGQVDPRKTVAVRAYGYEPATKLWAHYVLNGKRVKTVYVGALTGPCGNLVKHMREFPFSPVRPGTYSIYFQGSQTLDTRIGTPYRKV